MVGVRAAKAASAERRRITGPQARHFDCRLGQTHGYAMFLMNEKL
jgi:hypothetical protein